MKRVPLQIVSSVFIVAVTVVLSTLTVNAQTAQFNEAPMLAEQVDARELPPVEERLPKNPLVVEPLEQIGNYGGTLHRVLAGPSDVGGWSIFRASLIEWALGDVEPVPALAESWEVNEDGTVYTFQLREGAKWSDGHPFTADDLVFYYEAIASNPALTPSFPGWLSPGGEPGEIIKIDDYAVEFRFAVPTAFFPEQMAGEGAGLLAPKHYLSQFHPDYTPAEELQAKLEESGFDEWYQLFQAKNDDFLNPDLPVMRPWMVTQPFPANRMIAVRNPYYWKVDTEGNQLPYIDRMVSDSITSPDVILLRAASGDIDFQYRNIGFADMQVLLAGAEEGNYQVLRWREGNSPLALFMNQSHKDPVMRELMQNVSFRAALSHAINREEMNLLLYNGFGVTGHPIAPEGDAYHIPGSGNRFIEYDPELANKLLDEVGLDQRDAEGYRLRPDGMRLGIEILTYPLETGAAAADAFELVAQYWQAVGINATMNILERSLWTERVAAGDQDVAGYLTNGILWELSPIFFVPISQYTYFAPLYGLWYESEGQAGEEPTPTIRRLHELYEQLVVTIDQEKNLELGREIMRLHDENVWIIGMVGNPFQPVVVSNDLVNVLEDGVATSALLREAQAWFSQLSFRSP